jgi:hypothetical protein
LAFQQKSMFDTSILFEKTCTNFHSLCYRNENLSYKKD